MVTVLTILYENGKTGEENMHKIKFETEVEELKKNGDKPSEHIGSGTPGRPVRIWDRDEYLQHPAQH